MDDCRGIFFLCCECACFFSGLRAVEPGLPSAARRAREPAGAFWIGQNDCTLQDLFKDAPRTSKDPFRLFKFFKSKEGFLWLFSFLVISCHISSFRGQTYCCWLWSLIQSKPKLCLQLETHSQVVLVESWLLVQAMSLTPDWQQAKTMTVSCVLNLLLSGTRMHAHIDHRVSYSSTQYHIVSYNISECLLYDLLVHLFAELCIPISSGSFLCRL